MTRAMLRRLGPVLLPTGLLVSCSSPALRDARCGTGSGPWPTRTDYHPFMVAGVPIGGMTAGASQPKTTVQARLWGGQAGVGFDPNFQSPRDTVDNINREALAVMGSGVAFVVGS